MRYAKALGAGVLLALAALVAWLVLIVGVTGFSAGVWLVLRRRHA